MSEAGAQAAGPDAERLLDAGRVRAYHGPSLVLFLGISTAGSLAHRTFPGWSRLFCPGAVMRGVDLPDGASPAEFRELVAAMTANPRVLGAVVTSHKLRLFRACQDLLDYAEPLVALTQEIADVDTRDGVRAFARDPQSLDIILDGIGGPDARTGAAIRVSAALAVCAARAPGRCSASARVGRQSRSCSRCGLTSPARSRPSGPSSAPGKPPGDGSPSWAAIRSHSTTSVLSGTGAAS